MRTGQRTSAGQRASLCAPSFVRSNSPAFLLAGTPHPPWVLDAISTPLIQLHVFPPTRSAGEGHDGVLLSVATEQENRHMPSVTFIGARIRALKPRRSAHDVRGARLMGFVPCRLHLANLQKDAANMFGQDGEHRFARSATRRPVDPLRCERTERRADFASHRTTDSGLCHVRQSLR